jgi:putative restriction endonuclease
MDQLNKQFIKWYESINKNKSKGIYSPHKPLTILYALSKVLKSERYIDYNDERDTLSNIILFFTNKKSVKVTDPLYRLFKSDSREINVWDAIPRDLVTDKEGNIKITDAKERNLKCGFSDEYYEWLHTNKAYCQLLINQIMLDNFPESLHEALLTLLGIDELPAQYPTNEMVENTIKVAKRDPNFKFKIRTLFDNQCAFCGLKIYINDQLLSLEAAHIKAKQYGGPCSKDNGLLLCPTHHYTFDQGAWSLDDNLSIKLSKKASFNDKYAKSFLDFVGQSIERFIFESKFQPKAEYISWHRKNIFK